MRSARYSCQILMNLKFSLQGFEKYSNMKFNENSSMTAELVHAYAQKGGRSERHDEVTFRNFANAPKINHSY
jgi:hypothetical protein